MAESFGIYTPANDIIYAQRVTLFNNIEASINAEIPICIIPFDHRLERVSQEVNDRPTPKWASQKLSTVG
ncbi:MAG: hypothetical protein AAF821_09415 [Cyanobacteria bacterium P01_D01_bin.156]